MKITTRFIFKIAAVFLIIGLNYSGFFAIGQVLAAFFDNEASTASFSAASLDFSLTNQNVGGSIGVELGEDKEFISVVTKTSGSLDIQYKARAEKISGNDDFCNALKLEAFHSAISYDGALLSFDTAITNSLGTWAFEVKLPHTASNFSHGEECNVDLVFEGWRKDVADSSQSGFTDEERIQLRLVSRMIVLNEFLPRPSGIEYDFDFGNDDSDMPQGEWVEIYNNSDNSFDLAGWYIRDESATNKIMITADNTYPAGTVINGKSWLVVYMNKAVLNNDGDTMKLFDNANILVDSHAYTSNDYCDIEPTPGDENSTDTSGSCAGVPPNKSYARIPDGIGYWVDPIPTPGRTNVLEGENVSMASSILSQANEIIPEESIIDEPIIEELAEEPIIEIEAVDTTPENLVTDLLDFLKEINEEFGQPSLGDSFQNGNDISVTDETTEIIETNEAVPTEPVEEVIPEVVPEEPQVIEEQTVIVEEIIIEEQPVIEEQPIVVEETINVEPPPVSPSVDPPAPTE